MTVEVAIAEGGAGRDPASDDVLLAQEARGSHCHRGSFRIWLILVGFFVHTATFFRLAE